MSRRKKAQAAFTSAVVLLLLSALAAYLATTRLVESEKWVVHTHEVRAAIGDIDSAILRSGRARSAYLFTGDNDALGQFNAATSEIPVNLRHLRELTSDNPEQQALCSRLEDATAKRVALLVESVRSPSGASDQPAQAELQRRSLPFTTEMTAVMQQMREEEQQLLETREKTTHRLLVLTVIVLTVVFILALVLFAVQYRFLSAELEAREHAEQSAREGEESLRRLTGRLLQLQDAERRKFSRELHDSLGQYLASVKMNLDMFIRQGGQGLFAEAIQLLDQCIAETRTISHLLHPPLLDEVGLSSAARWYLEGFAQRSGVEVKFDLPENVEVLPKPVALGLFRILQESITNIHRHSGSTRAEVMLQVLPERVVLNVRDYGAGIGPALLNSLRTSRKNSGVGLAGMRERAHELGGEISIQACLPGTLVSVTIPLSRNESPASSAAD